MAHIRLNCSFHIVAIIARVIRATLTCDCTDSNTRPDTSKVGLTTVPQLDLK